LAVPASSLSYTGGQAGVPVVNRRAVLETLGSGLLTASLVAEMWQVGQLAASA